MACLSHVGSYLLAADIIDHTLNSDHRKMLSVSSDIRQRRAVRTRAAALNNLSIAAKLGNVQLIFMNVI